MSTSMLLTDFIQKELAIGRAESIKPDDDLLGAGVIDSLGVLRLVVFAEEKLGVAIPDEDVVIENFKSVAVLADYLDKRRTG